MKTLDKNTVYEVVAGDEVAVFCPKRLEWVQCYVEESKGGKIYITTCDSRVDEYNDNSDGEHKDYGVYIKHLRFNSTPERGIAAVMTRDEMAKLLENRSYVIG